MIQRKAELEGGHRDVDAALLALRPRSHYEKQLTLPTTTDPEVKELASLKKLVKGNGSRSPMPPEYVGKDIPWFERELAQLGPAARPVDDDVGYDVGPYEEGCRACEQRRLARLARLSEDRRHGLLLGLERARVARIALLEEKVEKNELRKQAIEAIALLDREKGAIETGVELQRIKDKLAEGDLQVEELEKWKTIKKDIDDVIGCISHLSSKLEGFVSHLYTNTIIPNVTRLSNEIIHLVDSTLVLDGSVSGDGKRIDWTISREDGARPPIETASGFQRFIAGLAVRIALGWAGLGVGAAGKQLFLDEGFTSCDSTNLSKVPNFLLSLLNIYDGILLVTHLEELKESESTHYLSIHCDQETGASVLLQQSL
jgi:DNA repair exonuclease SbcCD ATPase subunit